jgi:hypothetical protein
VVVGDYGHPDDGYGQEDARRPAYLLPAQYRQDDHKRMHLYAAADQARVDQIILDYAENYQENRYRERRP